QSKIRCKACLFLVLTGLISAGILAGCNRPVAVEIETAPPPYAGQVVKIASSSETVTLLINRYSPGWTNKAGASVEIVAVPKDGDLTRIADASVWIIRPAEMPRWAAAGLLTPLPSAYKAANGPYGWSGLLPLYREKLLRWAGESY